MISVYNRNVNKNTKEVVETGGSGVIGGIVIPAITLTGDVTGTGNGTIQTLLAPACVTRRTLSNDVLSLFQSSNGIYYFTSSDAETSQTLDEYYIQNQILPVFVNSGRYFYPQQMSNNTILFVSVADNGVYSTSIDDSGDWSQITFTSYSGTGTSGIYIFDNGDLPRFDEMPTLLTSYKIIIYDDGEYYYQLTRFNESQQSYYFVCPNTDSLKWYALDAGDRWNTGITRFDIVSSSTVEIRPTGNSVLADVKDNSLSLAKCDTALKNTINGKLDSMWSGTPPTGKQVIAAYDKDGNYIKINKAASVGSSTNPIYIDSDGVATACDTSQIKIGNTTLTEADLIRLLALL